MKSDEQSESSRRLELYRIKNSREPERIDVAEFQELNTIARINDIYMRTPKPQKKFNHWTLGQDELDI